MWAWSGGLQEIQEPCSLVRLYWNLKGSYIAQLDKICKSLVCGRSSHRYAGW